MPIDLIPLQPTPPAPHGQSRFAPTPHRRTPRYSVLVRPVAFGAGRASSATAEVMMAFMGIFYAGMGAGRDHKR